jgi:hypothetical protein
MIYMRLAMNDKDWRSIKKAVGNLMSSAPIAPVASEIVRLVKLESSAEWLIFSVFAGDFSLQDITTL